MGLRVMLLALLAQASALDAVTKTRARAASLARESRVPGTLVRAIARNPAYEAPPRAPRLAPAGVDVGVTITGCGGLYTYLFGVAAHIQAHFDLSGAAFASASAGAFPAFLLATGIDVERFHRTHNKELLRDAHARAPDPLSARRPDLAGRLGPLLCWNGLVKHHFSAALRANLGDEGHAALRGRHAVSITQVVRDDGDAPWRLRNALVDDYASVDELVDAYIASAYVPLYDRRAELTTRFRGDRSFDGGITDNAPRPYDDVDCLVLSPSKWRDHGTSLPIPLVNSDWDWCDAKFELGKRDAAAHHDEIARVLKPL